MAWMQVRRGLGPPLLAGTTGEPSAGRSASGIRQSRSATWVSAKVSLSEIASASPTPMLKLPKSFGRRPVMPASAFSIAAASSVGRQRRPRLRQQHDAQPIARRQSIRDRRRRRAQGRFGAAEDARLVDRDVERPAAARRHRGLGGNHLARRPVDRDRERLGVEHRHRRAAGRDGDVDADGGRRVLRGDDRRRRR